MTQRLVYPPLSLYVHIPWCVRKCPYCDFNSHATTGDLPEQDYVQALLADLDQDITLAAKRPLTSIFIGGGTPSLFSADSLARLLDGIAKRLHIDANTEITMEANPGTTEAARFIGYRNAGVNRLSMGVQSFDDNQLQRLGRIHSSEQAIATAHQAREVFTHINLDLMHGLPKQTPAEALRDLRQSIALAPTHLSWYQLTIEPQTQFWYKPPPLPTEDLLCDIEEQGHALLTDEGYLHYEISAFARPEHHCQHNLNYWRFGDYLGIGCGAHSKITHPNSQRVERLTKVKHPRGYLDPKRAYLDERWCIDEQELSIEYFMNRFRLFEVIPKAEYERFTGLKASALRPRLLAAINHRFLTETDTTWEVTPHGKRFVNYLLKQLIPEQE